MYDEALQFLKSVLPSTGRYCAARKKNGVGGMRHFFFDTIEALADWQSREGPRPNHGAYFALGSFGAADNRTTDNVLTLRALWIDIDVGADKAEKGQGYATRELALTALDKFLDAGFPAPSYIVSSGYGLHVYWALSADAARPQWTITATAFQKAWQNSGLLADPVSADAARVLRCPGTLNFKRDPGVPVEVLDSTGEVHDIAVLHAAVQKYAATPVQLAAAASAAARALGSNDDLLGGLPQRKSYIVPIATRCLQVGAAAKNRGKDCSEPLWYGLIQLARHTEEGRKAAHILSMGHPDYDPESVDQKLAQLEHRDIGPTTCEKFRSLNPRGCEGCQWKITSPIQLGEKEPEKIEPRAVVQELGVDEDSGESVVVTREVTAPVDAPSGFAYTVNGTEAEVFDAKGVPHWKVIFPGVIFPTRVFRAPGRPLEMEVQTVRHASGEARTFTLPVTAVGEAKETRSQLMSQIMIDAGSAPMLQKLLNQMGLAIQARERTIDSARQMGWQSENLDTADQFVYGNLRFSPRGVERGIPLDSGIEDQVRRTVGHAGTVAGALVGAQLFNRPHAQMHQAVYLTGLIGVFAPFAGAQNFAILSLVTRSGGEGKTTNCDAAMSHWFNPIAARSQPNDTANALHKQMSIHGTLPILVDEVTAAGRAKPELLVDLIYTASQGREKARMESSGAKQRATLPPWKCPVMLTSNMSVRQIVRADRGDAGALDARVIEMHYRRLDLNPAEIRVIEHVFYENYGWTGPAVAHHVATQLPFYREQAQVIRDQLRQRCKAESADRFWLNWGMGVMLARLALERLNMVNFPAEDLMEFVVNLIGQQRVMKQAELRSASDVLAEFLAENSVRILVGNKFTKSEERVDRLTTLQDNLRSAQLVGRTQLDERVLYVAVGAMRDFCTQRGFDFTSFQAEATESGLLAKTRVIATNEHGQPVAGPLPVAYSLGRGTALASAPLRVLGFNLNHSALRGHADDAMSVLSGPEARLLRADQRKNA